MWDGFATTRLLPVVGHDFNPKLSGSLVMWTGWPYGKAGKVEGNPVCWIWDGYKLFDLVKSSFSAMDPQSDGTFVTFRGYDGVDWEIYLATYITGTYKPQTNHDKIIEVLIDNGLAYVANGSGDLKIVDVSDAANPSDIGSLFVDEDLLAFDAEKKGDFIFLASRDAGVMVIDVTNPTSPYQVTTVKTSDSATRLLLCNEYLYVGDRLGGSRILDISDPTDPQEISTVQLEGSTYGIAAKDNFVFIANYWAGLRVIDVTVPESPLEVGQYDPPGIKAWDVGIRGDYAYVVCPTYGVKVVDISEPMNPTEVGGCALTDGSIAGCLETPLDITFLGDHAFVSNGSEGIIVIDISVPTDPEIVERFDTPGYAWGLEVWENFLYIADGREGLHIVDVSDYSVACYENAEDGTTNGWEIYDAVPLGVAVVNVFDDNRGSRVIELSGSSHSNGYRLKSEDGSNWENGEQFVIEWSLRYSEFFTVYVDTETTAGRRMLTYKPLDSDGLGDGTYVYHGLGSSLLDDRWYTFVRDLQADLEEAQPGVMILEVNSFSIRGSGRVDDVKLHRCLPDIYDSDMDGIANLQEVSFFGTDPTIDDTDEDGMNDGDESKFWSTEWNTDYDGDRLVNLLDSDSDDDGFLDGEEIRRGSDPADLYSQPIPDSPTPLPVTGQIEFQEVTDDVGISYMGRSFGASWGDFNGDGWPDLWVCNHSAPSHLYLNQGDGTFREIAAQVVDNLKGNTHGAAWADFDNDGDQDLIELVGAQCGTETGSNHLFLNTGAMLQDRAAILGLEYPLGRGRTPLWFEVDGDGLLDILLANFARQEAPSTLFQQRVDGFQDARDSVRLELTKNTNFAQLSDLNDDGLLDLICHGLSYPQRVYNTHTLPLQDLTDTIGLPPTTYVNDAAIADFNGDLRPDLYLCRIQNGSDVIQVDDQRIEARLVVNEKCETGFSFKTNGYVNFSLFPAWGVGPSEIFIGFDGYHPEELSFTLIPQDTTAWGIQAHDPGGDAGIYIGYEPTAEVWKLLVSNPNGYAINAVAEMTMPTSNVTCIGFDPDPFTPTLQDRLLIRGPEGFEDKAVAANLGIATECNAVVAGDFDNDMDLDLYLVCTGPVANLPNILYENQGNDTYMAVPNAGGAAGSTLGRGENVVTADYDGDGFLDLFVTNGRGSPPFYDDGPSQLFQNLGNDNNWIEIDLEGVVSNRDGIGTRVLATAGGSTQLREQGGGIHMFAQNHQRIHFGLGSNATIDRLVIYWPSGIVQEVGKIPADQILHIIESSTPLLLGKPAYRPGVNAGVFLWKDTFDGPYHLRVNGAGPKTTFQIRLVSSHPLLEAEPYSLEADDQWQLTESGFRLLAKVTTWHDGVDFKVAPGSRTLLAVEQDGVSNPRQLHVGLTDMPLSPAGWIVGSEDLAPRPAFQRGYDLGLFIGKGSSGGTVEARWNGDGARHLTEVDIIGSKSFGDLLFRDLETSDIIKQTNSWVNILGRVSTWWDGVDITFAEDTQIGVAYLQDGLFPPHRVNPGDGNMGMPNAYWLPILDPYESPIYDLDTEAGIFLWKDEGGTWHFRSTAGNGYKRYSGSITSDIPATNIAPKNLEDNDMLDAGDPTRINFDFKIWYGRYDGFDFQFPPEAKVYLNIEAPEEAASLLHVGKGQYPVSRLPVDISGW